MSVNESRKSFYKNILKNWSVWIQLLLTVLAVVGIVLLLIHLNAKDLFSKLSVFPWFYLILIIVLNIPVTLVRTLRTRFALNKISVTVPFWRLTGINLIGQLWGSLTPAGAGDFSRSVLWRYHDSLSTASGSSIVIYEKITTTLHQIAVGGVCLSVLYLSWWTTGGILLIALAVLTSPWWLVFWWSNRPTSVNTKASFLRRWLSVLVKDSKQLTSSPLFTLKYAGFSLVVFLFCGLQIYFLALGLHSKIPFLAAIAVFCFFQFGSTLAVLPFGIGTADLSAGFILHLTGLSILVAAVILVLMRAVQTLPLGLAGGISTVIWGRPPKNN